MHPIETGPARRGAQRASGSPARARSGALRLALSLALSCALGSGNARAQGGEAPTVELSAGIHLIHAELADNDVARMRGLMFRRTLAPNHGMLFYFDRPERQCMWMRNTLLPLAVAFIGDDGAIVNIEEMRPQTEDNHCAASPVRYALEMEGQWFKRHGIGPGSQIGGIVAAHRAR